jgi:hypothetical protein
MTIEINVLAKKASPWGSAIQNVAEFKEHIEKGTLMQMISKEDNVPMTFNPTWSKLDQDADLQKYLDKFVIKPHISHSVVVYHGIIVKAMGGEQPYFVLIMKRNRVAVQKVIDSYKLSNRLINGFSVNQMSWRVLDAEHTKLVN